MSIVPKKKRKFKSLLDTDEHVIICDNCQQENVERNYYCWCCGEQIKPFHIYRKFGERNMHYYTLDCLKEDVVKVEEDLNEENEKVDSYTPYRSTKKKEQNS